MRKLFFLFVVLLITTTLWARDFKSGDLYYSIISSSEPYTVGVTSGGDYSSLKTVTIPETVTYDGITYSVTILGYGAFYDCDGLESVTIGNSVTILEDRAFYDCEGLTSVTIGNSVTSIGDWAFEGCSSLTSITIPNSVTSIGGAAFYDCDGLESVTIGNSVTSIGGSAFYDCSGLTSVTIGNSVTSIGNDAFGYCSKLTKLNYTGDIAGWCNIKFSSSTANPMNYSNNFYINDQEIKDVVIPNSVDSIHAYAFYDCDGLTSVTIGNSVTSIGDRAFYDCDGLESVTIGNSVTNIGEYAFYDCEGLTFVTIGNSVTSIGDRAFQGCSSLTSITIPNSVTSIGVSAFIYCDGLTSVVIGNSVTNIGANAFYDCYGLESVTIGNSVTSIGDDAFGYCSKLTKLNYTGDIAGWCNIKFSSSTANPMNYSNNFYINDQEIKDVVIPNSVDSIHAYAFYDCDGLTSVTIGNSVTSIGDRAFYDCDGLTSMTIGNSVTNIGEYAFYDCDGLESVTIGNSVTNIGEYTFYDCEGLTSVTIGNSVTSIGDRAFEGCSSLTSITIPNSVTSIGGSAFYDCDGLTSVVIGNSVTNIGDWAFVHCFGLTSVIWNAKNYPNLSSGSDAPFYSIRSQITNFVFGDSVEHIPAYLCYEMSNLSSVTIGNSVTSIGNDVFSGCSELTSVIWNAKNYPNPSSYSDAPLKGIRSQITNFVFGDSVEHIPAYLCYNRDNFTSITIPNSVTSIGNDAFYDCDRLTKTNYAGDIASWCNIKFSSTTSNPMYYSKNLYINNQEVINELIVPNTVDSIHDYAFYGCHKLTSVTIPSDVTSIGDSAFYACNLSSMIIRPSTPPVIGAGIISDKNITIIYIPDNSKSAYVAAWGSDYRFVNNENSLELHVETPGTLEDMIFAEGQRPIHVAKLKLSGTLNDADFTCIHEKMTSLTELDLCDIANTSGIKCKNKTNLVKISFPKNLLSITEGTFTGCSSLTSIVWNAKNYPNPKVSYTSDIPFYNVLSQITNFVFGDSVEHIPAYLCYNLSNITSITIPNSVTSIGNYAFSGCSSLTSITIPNSVTSIGNHAFGNCDGLTKTNYTGDIASWCDIKFGDFAANPMYYTHNFFIDNQEIKDLVIPNSVTSIGDNAFYSCSGLTSVTIGNSVTSIGDDAFIGCSGLTSVTIGNSVTSIGWAAFRGCSSLTSITIPNSVTSIGNYAFYGCSSLTSITIPNSVTSIGASTFVDCSKLTSVIWNAKNYPNPSSYSKTPFYCIRSQIQDFVFGDSIEHIPSYFCYEMSRLTSVAIGNSLTSIGDDAFSGCSKLTSILWNVKNYPNPSSDSNAPFYDFRSQITNFTFGDNVEYIPAYLCYEMSNLTSITIPNSVMSIGNMALYGCSALIITNYMGDIAEWCNYKFATPTANPIYYSKNFYINNQEVNELVVPNTVDSIHDYAFYGCKSIQSVNLSNGIKHIGNEAFYGCKSIQSVNLSNSIKHIGNEAFYGCSNLGYIIIPESVTHIGTNTFADCTALTTIQSFATTPPDASNTGADTDLCTLIVPKNAYGDYIRHDYWGLFWDIQTSKLNITSNNVNWGNVSCIGAYFNNEPITLIATPNKGCYFQSWSDGNTDNPRSLVLTQDTSLVANFEIIYLTSDTVTICYGETYQWHDNTYDTSGVYIDTLNTGIVTLYLTILPQVAETIEEITICDGETYTWQTDSKVYAESGTYSVTLQDANGCDSIVTLHLTILPNAMTVSEEIVLCTSELPYEWYGQSLAEAGSYTATEPYIGTECDSVIHELALKVYVQTLPDSVTLPLVRTDEAINVTIPTAEIRAYIAAETWYAPNAEVAWYIIKDRDWTPLTTEPVKASSTQVVLKYAVETDCGSVESEKMVIDIKPTSVENTQSEKVEVYKFLRDGQLLILRDGKTYNIMGQEL